MNDAILNNLLDCTVFFGALLLTSSFIKIKLLKEIRDILKNK
jgi:hypothetical protein